MKILSQRPVHKSELAVKLHQVFVFVIMIAAVRHGRGPELVNEDQHTSRRSQQTETSRPIVKNYQCPMHPEVRSTKPGKCPKCGMDLRLAPADPTSPALRNPTTMRTSRWRKLRPHCRHQSMLPTQRSQPRALARKMVIPDVEILDQNGNALHFYSDLIKGKTVAINFIFTNCTTICPPLAATFARVQKEMGDKVGRDVHFISISVDPVTDTPERFKAWGAKFKAGAGWTFVTGDKQEIDKLLNALGASVARREDHSPTVIVGNDTQGVWTRTYGLAKVSPNGGVDPEGDGRKDRRVSHKGDGETMKAKPRNLIVLVLRICSVCSRLQFVAQDQPSSLKPAPPKPVSLPEQPLAQAAKPALSAAAKYFSDVELINQDGQTSCASTPTCSKTKS